MMHITCHLGNGPKHDYVFRQSTLYYSAEQQTSEGKEKLVYHMLPGAYNILDLRHCHLNNSVALPLLNAAWLVDNCGTLTKWVFGVWTLDWLVPLLVRH